jgi:hypothetical protein
VKKERVISAIDLIPLLWGIIFLFSPMISKNLAIEIIVFFELSGVSLVAYIVYVILLRVKWNRKIEKENQALQQLEKENADSGNESENKAYFEVKQKILENMIEKELISLYPAAKIMKNIYCPKLDGSTSEIDVLMINKDGIFMFEAKNFSARISGHWGEEKLMATYENGKQIEIQNPVMQNSSHFQHLRKLLGVSQTQHIIKNIVILGDSVRFSRDEIAKTCPGFASVGQFKDISKLVYLRSKLSKNVYKDSQVESIYETIQNQLCFSPEKKAAHDQQIKEIRNNAQ